MSASSNDEAKLITNSKKQRLSIETMVVGLYPPVNDPYGATSMPIYQSATFQQPTATTFGQYDYTRSGMVLFNCSSSALSLTMIAFIVWCIYIYTPLFVTTGNPTRDALQNQIAILEGTENAKSFCFTTGMAALTTIGKLACSGDEIIVNDDSYGGTYRLMSKVCSRQGIKVTYANLLGKDGPSRLLAVISSSTRIG